MGVGSNPMFRLKQNMGYFNILLLVAPAFAQISSNTTSRPNFHTTLMPTTTTTIPTTTTTMPPQLLGLPPQLVRKYALATCVCQRRTDSLPRVVVRTPTASAMEVWDT